MLLVLLDSAVRSLLLGFVVWVLLKGARLSDTRTETAIWTAVLVAALLMPMLSRNVPGLAMPVPHLPAAASPTGLLSLHPDSLPSGIWQLPELGWLVDRARTCFTVIYFLGFCVNATRLALGLLLALRLYRRATPVRAAWAHARNIRVTAGVRSPVSLARTILLPTDYGEWNPVKRNAILAHEESHIARGDFFVQLVARLHCTVFWFSPFAWWLQTKLAEIAETASDEAAVRRLNDRATYAEILVDVSRRAQKSPLTVAMAKSSFIERRIERILSDAPMRSLSLPQRMLSVVSLAILAIAVAAAKAAIDPIVGAPRAEVATVAKTPVALVPLPRNRAAVRTTAGDTRVAHEVYGHHDAASVPHGRNDTSYNPRALLDPVYAPKPNYVPANSIVHAGRQFYIRSTEKPVADVSVTYAMDRQRR